MEHDIGKDGFGLGKGVSAEDAAKWHPLLDSVFWCVRILLVSVFAVFLTVFVATVLIPSMGSTFLEYTGLSAESSFAEVMAIWLVPQLFVAGLLGFCVVKAVIAVNAKLKDAFAKLMIRKEKSGKAPCKETKNEG